MKQFTSTRLLVFNFLFLLSSLIFAKETVRVALTSVQPPFVFDDEMHSGLVSDLVTEMNRSQDKFKFEIELIPPSRLLKDHDGLQIDLIAFNDVRWGWDKQGGLGSHSLTEGRDLFFSFREFVNDINKQNPSIAAVRGFHYKFAKFNPAYLENTSHISSLEDETSVVEFVSLGRAEKGVASEAYLNWIALSNPELSKRIIVLGIDHQYTRRFIVMPRSVISLDEVNELLVTLKSNGLLERIFARYGQPVPPLQ